MGVGLRIGNRSFMIPAGECGAALAAVLEAAPAYSKPTPRERCVQLLRMGFAAPNVLLAEVVRTCWGFEPVAAEGGGVAGVVWGWEKATGREMEWMKAVAPYVPDGCFIEMHTEDGEHLRFLFREGAVRSQYAELVWRDDAPTPAAPPPGPPSS